jgi:hypothetical protein
VKSALQCAQLPFLDFKKMAQFFSKLCVGPKGGKMGKAPVLHHIALNIFKEKYHYFV